MTASPVSLGLRANLPQFTLLVAVNGLVGATVGQERTLLPLLAVDEFGVTAASAGLAFLVAFGAAKAVANLAAGALSDRYGRKPVLLAGWLIGLPVPLLIIAAPEWSWIVLANLLLGVNQGLCWSTTVAMKVDLVGPARRGLALGLNESAGYVSVAGAALVTGLIAAQTGLRPEPFLLGLAVVALGLGASALFVRETSGHVAHEASTTTVHAHARRREACGASSSRAHSAIPRSRRRARPGSSTTSTTAWPGASSRSSSRAPDCRSARSGCSWRSTRRSGA